MAKPAKESWQVWYWAIKVWCSYLDFSNSIPIPHPLTQNYQPDIKISRDIQPLLHFAVSSNILLTTSILLCHTLRQFCRFVSQHQKYCRLQKEKKRYSGCFFLLCSLRALLEPILKPHHIHRTELPWIRSIVVFQITTSDISLYDSPVMDTGAYLWPHVYYRGIIMALCLLHGLHNMAL